MKNSLSAALCFRKAHFVREGKTSFEDSAFLDHPSSSYEHIDIVHFGSEAHNNTHCGWYHDGKRILLDPKNPIHGNGDGTIMTWAWKFMVGGLPNHRIVHCSNDELVHVQLMTDSKLQQTAADMLGTKFTEPNEKNKGLIDSTTIASAVAMIGIAISLFSMADAGSIGRGGIILSTTVVVAALGIFFKYCRAPSCPMPYHDIPTSAVLITGGKPEKEPMVNIHSSLSY